MSVQSGRPVLATLTASCIPAIPTGRPAIRGRMAAKAAVYDVATHPGDLAARLAFDKAVADARSDSQPFEYSQAFAAGADEAIHEVADVLDADTAGHLDAIRRTGRVAVVEPDSGAESAGEVIAAFERFAPNDVFGTGALRRARAFTDELLDRDL